MQYDHPVPAEAVQGDPEALAFLRMIARILHTWDDLIDKDHGVSDQTINEVFAGALVDLPRNAFYREHFSELNPILVNAIINWRIATQMEREAGPANDLHIAFVIRSAYVDLLTMSAAIIGGKEWAVAQGMKIRRWAHHEGFETYLNNLHAEKGARDRRQSHVL